MGKSLYWVQVEVSNMFPSSANLLKKIPTGTVRDGFPYKVNIYIYHIGTNIVLYKQPEDIRMYIMYTMEINNIFKCF